MQERNKFLGGIILVVMTVVTGVVLLRGQSLGLLWENLKQVRIPFLLGGLTLMLGYVGCEAVCTRQILKRMGHQVSYSRCLGYSFVGFYVSSITPSASGGQPAQIYCMSQDRIPAAHGTLSMMLSSACYQTATLIWGGAVWFLCSKAGGFQGGMGLLLLYGAGTMVLLTVGMGMVMFLPGLSRRICGGILKFMEALHLLRNPSAMREKLDHQMAEYAKGAVCIKANPGLALQVLGLCLARLGMLYSVPWMVYHAFGLQGHSWIQIAGLQALLTLAVSNLPLPGAVGPAEGCFMTAFATVFGPGMVTPAMLVSRGISFYAFLVISFLVSVAVHLRIRRQSRERALREMAASRPGGRVKAMRRYLRTQEQEVW